MTNCLPDSIDGLITRANDLAAGLATHGGPLEILQNTETKVRADITAADAAIGTYETAKNGLILSHSVLRDLKEDCYALLCLGRDNLKPVLGTTYNQSYDQLGLVGSLKIPQSAEKLERLLFKFKTFFAANQTYEVSVKSITAARFTELYEDLRAARTALAAQAATRADAKIARDLKITALRKRVLNAIAEIGMKLAADDPLWKAFGLNIPAAVEMPPVPENLVAVLIGPTAVALRWDAAARAGHYRVWKKVVGVDSELIPVGNPADLDFVIEALPANATIEIAVSAVNEGGESAKTAVVMVQTT